MRGFEVAESRESIGQCTRAKRGGNSVFIEGDEEVWPQEPTPGGVREADTRVKVVD